MGLSLWLLPSAVRAQEEPIDTSQLNLEDLLNTEIQVASLQPKTIRETPGIVTLVTRQEIIDSGARDLIDVLRRVPGFDVELDAEGITSLGVRGIWGQEGKVLLLIDGQEMNDLFYGTLQLGNHFTLENVESIEIIRGPGSALYGGHAELAVIKITTRGAKWISGVNVVGYYGELTHGPAGLSNFGRRNLTVSYGQVFPSLHDLAITASVFGGEANASDRNYIDAYGARYNMMGVNTMTPLQVNIGADLHDIHFRFIHDDYWTTNRDGFNKILPQIGHKRFTTTLAELKYEGKVTDTIKIIPRVAYKRSVPWRETNAASPIFYDLTAERYTAGVMASYEPTDKLHLNAGGEVYFDRAKANQPAANIFYRSGLRNYQNVALFAEGEFDNPITNTLAGLRFENHSLFGSSVVPRIALTKLIDKFHFKLLASGAFRTPDLQAIAYNPLLKPERTTAFEAEAGYELTKNLFVSVNAFNVTVQGPIVYYVDEFNASGGYSNSTRTGSRGVEADFRANYSWGFADINYSFYQSTNMVSEYSAPANSSIALAFPAHKVSLGATYKVWKGLKLSPSATILSARFGYDQRGLAGEGNVKQFPSTALANLFVSYDDIITKGLNVGAGVFDLFDSNFQFIQAYNALHAPLPSPGREVVLRAGYTATFE